MAFTSVTTKVDTAIMSRRIIQVLSGGAGTGDMIDLESLPFAAAHLVQTSGTAITSVQLAVGIDGIAAGGPPPVMTNAVKLGPAVLVAHMPNVIPLTGFTIIGSTPGTTDIIGNGAPNRFIQFTVVGGDATSVVTITIEAMGTRG